MFDDHQDRHAEVDAQQSRSDFQSVNDRFNMEEFVVHVLYYQCILPLAGTARASSSLDSHSFSSKFWSSHWNFCLELEGCFGNGQRLHH